MFPHIRFESGTQIEPVAKALPMAPSAAFVQQDWLVYSNPSFGAPTHYTHLVSPRQVLSRQ
jgi:hypothetical protein